MLSVAGKTPTRRPIRPSVQAAENRRPRALFGTSDATLPVGQPPMWCGGAVVGRPVHATRTESPSLYGDGTRAGWGLGLRSGAWGDKIIAP